MTQSGVWSLSSPGVSSNAPRREQCRLFSGIAFLSSRGNPQSSQMLCLPSFTPALPVHPAGAAWARHRLPAQCSDSRVSVRSASGDIIRDPLGQSPCTYSIVKCWATAYLYRPWETLGLSVVLNSFDIKSSECIRYAHF